VLLALILGGTAYGIVVVADESGGFDVVALRP
jgi:hypothetical protein